MSQICLNKIEKSKFAYVTQKSLTNSRLYGANVEPIRIATEQEPSDVCRRVVGNISDLMR